MLHRLLTNHKIIFASAFILTFIILVSSPSPSPSAQMPAWI
jgi:hypothetical protein